jgi:hypothetical protein
MEGHVKIITTATAADRRDLSQRRAKMANRISRCAAIAALVVTAGAVTNGAHAGVGLDVNIDPLAIGNAIAGAVRNNQDREACITDLANATDNQTQYRKNILVVNLAEHPYLHSNNVVFYGSAQCKDARVAVWAFGDGQFTREGDGGYINWFLIGNFTRSGDQGRNVTFRPR